MATTGHIISGDAVDGPGSMASPRDHFVDAPYG